jgi:hypothetical protein
VRLGHLLEEDQELPVTVPGVAGIGGDLPGGHLQGGEQGGGAVSPVVVRAALGRLEPHRQQRRGAVQGLDLGLLVDADHHGVGGRVQVEPDYVADLGLQLWVGGELERLHAMGLQVPVPPDPGHLGEADRHPGAAEVIGHQPGRPVGDAQLGRRRIERGDHHRRFVDHRRTTRPGPIGQRVDPAGGIPSPPGDDRLPGHPDLPPDLGVGQPIRRQQHHPRSLHVPGRRRRRSDQRPQASTITGAKDQRRSHGDAPLSHIPSVKSLQTRDTRQSSESSANRCPAA